MTPNALMLFGAVLGSVVLPLLGIQLLNWWWPRPRRREPETPVPPRSAADRAWGRLAAARAALLRLVHRRDDVAAPAAHIGATLGFGAELRALRTAPVAPELVDPDWWRKDLDRIERAHGPRYQAAADRIGEALTAFIGAHEISGFKAPAVVLPKNIAPCASLDTALLRLRDGVREPASAYRPRNADTGQLFDPAELDALLAGEYAGVTG